MYLNSISHQISKNPTFQNQKLPNTKNYQYPNVTAS
jgi:hypothetical protein